MVIIMIIVMIGALIGAVLVLVFVPGRQKSIRQQPGIFEVEVEEKVK